MIDISRLDVAPESIPWWRAMSNLTEQQKSAVTRFNSNNISDYKQINASLAGVLQQYQALVKYVSSIPVSETRSNEVSGWGVPSVGETLLVTQTFTVPNDKNYVTAAAELDSSPNTGSAGVIGYLTINGVQSGSPGITSGGSAAIFISLGFSFAVAPGSSFDIKYYMAPQSGSIAASPNNQANCNAFVTYSWR